MTAGELKEKLTHALSWEGLAWDAEVDMLCPTWGYEKIARLEIEKDGKSLTIIPEAEA